MDEREGRPDAAPATAPPEVPSPPSLGRVRAARLLAVGADAVQIFFFPIFGEGFASPADALLDMGVAIALVKLVGFHWAFLPGVIVEALPGLDLAPTWTAAVLLATAGRDGPWSRPRRLLAIAFALALAVLLSAALLFWLGRRGRVG
jgi:hypothetical protein